MPTYKGDELVSGRAKTAYETAVAGGFSGTEQEFNDLLASLGDFLLKSTVPARLYATGGDGSQAMIAYGVAALSDLLVRRASNGQIALQLIPVAEDHATSKKYVDDGLSGHNTSGTAHNDIRLLIDAARVIAEGKERAIVFDTEADLDTWLANPANVSTLQIGDNFYIRETDVPDYWWDGTQKIEMEGAKVDLTDYYTKIQSDSRYLQAITKALVEAVLTGDISSHTHSNYLTAITKALVEAVLVGDISSHGHSAYSPTSHSHALNDFCEGEDTGKISLASMVITKRLTNVTAGTAQSFSMASVAMNDVDFCIKFRATAATTVAIPPSSATYETFAKTSYSVAANAAILIHVFRSSADNKYYINVEEKQ